MHLLPTSLPIHVAKVLGHFRTKLNQRSDKSNVDSREFRQTRPLFKKNMTATSESFKTFLLSKRLTKTSRRLSSGLQKLGDKSSDS